MPDGNVQFINQAQQASRSVYETMQGIAETQITIVQRLGGIQQSLINQAIEATNDQVQLISRIREPRQYASAQAELVRSYGQRYIDTVKNVVSIAADAWQEYSDRIEKGVRGVADRTQRANSSRKAA
jgi:hypothetical protein